MDELKPDEHFDAIVELLAAERDNLNPGMPQDMWIPEYGWIIKDGKPTYSGLKWHEDMKLKKTYYE